MKKRFFSILLAFSMLCTFIPITSSAEEGTKYGDYLYYELFNHNTEIIITDCDTSVTEIVVPSEINGLPVTAIGDSAFEYCTSLTSVTLSDNVTSINAKAFRYCTELMSIAIPDNVTNIGVYAFSVCGSLTSAKIPDSVTYIGDGAFASCSKLESITIPDGVTSISKSMLSDCSNLKSVTIHDGITSIGSYAFSNCSALTNIAIPYSITDIGGYAFSGCDNLTNITVDENNTEYSSADSVLYNKDKTKLIKYPIGNKTTEFVIPNGVTKVDADAFCGCDSLASITIPATVTNIGISSFDDCGSLRSITVDGNNADYSSVDSVLYDKNKTVLIRYPIGNERTEFAIPDTVTEIGGFAFSDGNKLISITIPDGVTKIGGSAFYGCSKLANVTIPNGVTKIEDYVFYGCSGLVSVIIPDDVTRIGTCAFSDCGSLTSIEIPDNVSSIASYVFTGCNSLMSITVGENNNNYVSVDGVLYDKYKTELIQYPIGNTKTEFIIPNGVAKIDERAFSGCSNLTSITIPTDVNYIARYAFSDCKGLKYVYFKGTKSEWNNIYIGFYNDELKNATMHFNKKTTAEITKSETDSVYTFEVNAEDKYENCCVYVAVYNENGSLVEINLLPLDTEENTSISVEKNDSGKTIKVFLWTDTMQPITENAKEFEI